MKLVVPRMATPPCPGASKFGTEDMQFATSRIVARARWANDIWRAAPTELERIRRYLFDADEA